MTFVKHEEHECMRTFPSQEPTMQGSSLPRFTRSLDPSYEEQWKEIIEVKPANIGLNDCNVSLKTVYRDALQACTKNELVTKLQGMGVEL